MVKAIFLDKDGTLIENIPYNVDPDKIKLTEHSLEGLALLQQSGYKLIIVSNQAGVAYGRFHEEELIPVKNRLDEMFQQAGLNLDGFYYCPHHPNGRIEAYAIHCFCRKPNPGLLFRAAREHDLNLADSWVIGDILNDIEAGRRAECRTILIDNGNETEWKLSTLRRPHHTVKDLWEAAQIITAEEAPIPVDLSKPAYDEASSSDQDLLNHR